MATEAAVSKTDVVDGLHQLGLSGSSSVILHASLSSFGHVDGGAETLTEAVAETCGTVLMLAGSGDLTRLPAPPGLHRPDNAFQTADTWADFDQDVASAQPFSDSMPVDRWLGQVAEQMRLGLEHSRGPHPLLSFLAVGTHAQRLTDAQRLDWPLGPIEELERLGGHVLLLGVGHTSNTTIHLAEQRLRRARFYRYAITAPGVWSELPNCGGESHRFDEIEPTLKHATAEVMIGNCRARCVSVRDVLDATKLLISDDPAALLCEDATCRCGAALQQRLRHLAST